MTALQASIEGIGFWGSGLPSWEAARQYLHDGTRTDDAARRPSPQLLAANERRRAPDTVAVALDAALAACQAAGRNPADVPSVFTSTHGDIAITDYMCATLAEDPRQISPTKFHNSVHNAPAGYWTIGAGTHTPATAISAGPASFAQGLLEAMTQLATGSEAVLLVGYDVHGTGPLAEVAASAGLLGGALLLSRDARPGCPQLRVALQDHDDATPARAGHRLAGLFGGNAMAPMLPLFEALALERPAATLLAGPGRWLKLELDHG